MVRLRALPNRLSHEFLARLMAVDDMKYQDRVLRIVSWQGVATVMHGGAGCYERRTYYDTSLQAEREQ